MKNVLDYYEFSSFRKDQSDAFNGNEISFTEINKTHFLIFEKNNATLNLYVSRYEQRNDIGVKPPVILELVMANYDKGVPEHRIALRKYLG
ncbi:hypothetical protein [Polaribacter sp.]|uniref:hypothetical protein n=1 Tax=Polaribacter sp. TaxID=1920175 RepID=UPI003EF6759D